MCFPTKLEPAKMVTTEIAAKIFFCESNQNAAKQIFITKKYIYANPKKPIHHIVFGFTKAHKQANASDTAAMMLGIRIMI